MLIITDTHTGIEPDNTLGVANIKITPVFKNRGWLPLPAMWRTRYYQCVVELSCEVEVARSFLSLAGMFNGMTGRNLRRNTIF